jgi:hypothetical protein
MRGPLLAIALLAALAVARSTIAGEPDKDGGAGADAHDAGSPARVRLDGPKLEALLAEIARARKDVKTLRASFVQERRLALLSTTVRSTGELVCASRRAEALGERLRWDLAPPDDIVYFIGPEGLSYKTKASSATLPARADRVAGALRDLRALLGGDLGALRERYALDAARGDADVEITGVAKDKSASIRSFALVLDKGLVAPVRARLVEGKSDGIELSFSNVMVNVAVDPARLRP